MAAAAYRIYDYERTTSLATVTPAATATATTATALEGSIPSEAIINPPPTSVVESGVTFFTKLFLKSALLAGVVKYGELFLDFPFTSSNEIAAAVITVPVLVNTLQWAQRSIAKTDITYH